MQSVIAHGYWQDIGKGRKLLVITATWLFDAPSIKYATDGWLGMRKNTIWLVVLLILLTGGPASGWFWDKKEVTQNPIDSGEELALKARKMPDFSEKNITSEGFVDSKDFAGKVLLVNFWATWCPPCRKEIPALIRIQDRS